MRVPNIIRWAVRLLVLVVVLAAVGLAVGVWWLSTDAGKSYTQNLIQNELSQSTGYTIAVSDLTFSFPLTARMDSLALSDSKGEWLKAEHVSIHVLPTPSIASHVVIRKIKADSLSLIRAPEVVDADSGESDGIDLSILAADIRRLSLGTALTGLEEALEMAAQGQMWLDAGDEAIAFEAAAQSPQGEAVLAGNYTLRDERLLLDRLQFTHGEVVIKGKAALQLDTKMLEASLATEAIDLASFVPSLQGKAVGEATVSGSFSKPEFMSTIRATALQYDERALPDMQTEISGTIKDKDVEGVAHLTAGEMGSGETHYRLSDQKFFLTALKAQHKDMNAAGDLAINRESGLLDGKLSARIPRLQDVAEFLPLAVQGRAELTAVLSPARNQSAEVTVALKNITTPDGKMADTTLKASFTDLFAVVSGAPDIRLALDVDGVSRLFLPAAHVVKGTAKAHLKLAKEALSGQITFSDGSYRHLDLGVSLQRISANITLQDNRFTVGDFHAEDKNGKVVTGRGKGSLSPVQYDAAFSGKKLALFFHPNVRGALSMDVKLAGDGESGKLTGTIQSNGIEIHLPDRLAGTVPELNVVKTIPAKKKTRVGAASPEGYPLLLDVVLEAENQVFIRGWGVDAELQGKLALTGHAADPKIEGKLSTVRGRYEEFGKVFRIKKGELLFDGDMPPSPFLTVIASVKADGVEVMPKLSGPMLDPALTIESSPSMPQEEALSLLLFGKDSKQISPFQAAQLANSLRKLSGKGGPDFDPLGTIRGLIGVDDLSINNDGDSASDVSVGVGKYIADGVYLEVERGAEATSGKASVEVEVTPSISVESSTGASGQNSVGVNWKHDY